MAENFENKELLKKIIVGRVEPHIYAFSTNLVPNCLKVGDTGRPVNVRLEEWKTHYPSLQKEYSEEAKVSPDIYFRDYSVHDYLIYDGGKQKLNEADIDSGIYYSQEFFKETTVEDIKKAVEDIKSNYVKKTGKYKYYNVKNNLSEESEDEDLGTLVLRDNQKEVVDKFIAAKKNGQTNLLMYAVMRFGKTFTALMCAKEMDAKLVLIVSGKADVGEEWKKTCTCYDNFKHEFAFCNSKILENNHHLISDCIANNLKLIVFLTLQDLQGEKIKEKHKEIFETLIDLLIVDETHFAARAPIYGYVLKEKNTNVKYENVKGPASYDKEENTIGELSEQLKVLQARITLHLSGTPYRILMGSEFQEKDVICHCQFSDIVDAQKSWNADNLDEEEWKNPYFGFPQMIRFAFHPSKSAKEKLDEYKKSGRLYTFSALLEPKSKIKDKGNLYKKFVNEKEVLELFQVIDGSKEDENVLGFLDYDPIKAGKMCRHIVCVLPYCASCDALEELINKNREKFKNLDEYKILNISGVEKKKGYKKVEDIQAIIRECENSNQKTLTLTVNRMLTGTTVEQWDTMIYLKDTSSPQEYDQAIFRLQNQYVRDILATDGSGKVIKYNMKPQTLLVDFDPNRVFILQEQKAQIENFIGDKSEESEDFDATEKIRKEIEISPIITIDKNRIEQVTANNIIDYVSQYSRDRGVMEETLDIPVDLRLMKVSVINDTISRQAEIGSSGGLKVDSVKDENGSDFNFTEENTIAIRENIVGDEHGHETTQRGDVDDVKFEIKTFENKFRTYYARILFYAFLVDERVKSLKEIICTMSKEENIALAQHLDIDCAFLQIVQDKINKFILSQLDYKIKNINELAHDEELDPLTRVHNAMIGFNRLSNSEVVTPQNICREMVESFPEDELEDICNKHGKILDIAGKVGEFATAIYERFTDKGGLNKEHDAVKDLIYTIPTSKVAYEFTKKIYKILGLNVNNIATFTSYDFLDLKCGETWEQLKNEKFSNVDPEKNGFFKQEDTNMKFDFIIGNPPYQEQVSQNESNDSLSKQLFPSFIQSAINLDAKSVILITPSRWFAGDAQDKSFVKLREFLRSNNHIKVICNYKNGKDVFPNTEIKGGVSYFVYEKDYTGKVKFTNIENGQKDTEIRNLFEDGVEIVLSDSTAYSILLKVKDSKDFVSLTTITTGRNAFGIIGKQDVVDNISSLESFDGAIELRCKAGTTRWTKREYITKGKDIVDKYKVFISKSAGSPNKDHKIIGIPYVAGKASACTDSLFPVGKFDDIEEAANLAKYMKTKFLRYMVSIVKMSQNVTQIVYRFVPLQNFTFSSDIDWSKSIPEIDQQLYVKYGLDEDEIAFIESHVKEME